MSEPTIGNVTWTTLYDAASGNLPTHASYGFTKTGAFSTETVSGGWLRLTSAGSAYYTKNSAMPAVQSGKVFLFQARLRLESGHVYSTGFDLGVNGLAASQADYDRVLINGSWSGWANTIYAVKSFITSLGNAGDKNLLSGLAAFDLMIIWRLSVLNSGQTTHEVWYRDVGSYGVSSAKGYKLLLKVVSFTNQNTNTLIFGDFYDGLGQDWSVSLLRAGWTDAATIQSTNGKTLFAAIPDEATVDVTHSAATVSPAGTVTASAAIGGDALATLAGSSWNGSATTSVTGNTVTKAITLSAATVAPAGTVTATMTPQTGVTVTIDGATINGTPATVVTGVEGATPTAPTIGPYPRWVSGQLRFYKPAAGSSTLTGGSYATLSSAQASGADTVADSNAWASITWRATDGTGEYVTTTDLGLTVSATTWYRDRVTDSKNLVAEGQTAVYGGDDDNALCIVTFSDLTAGTTVAAKLSAPVTVNGVLFPTYQASYTTTVAVNGTASLTLPRCNAGTNQDGNGTVFGIFTGPFILNRRIPDAATATFASLESP